MALWHVHSYDGAHAKAIGQLLLFFTFLGMEPLLMPKTITLHDNGLSVDANGDFDNDFEYS